MIAQEAVCITDGTTVAGVDVATQGLKIAGTITAGPPVPGTFSNNLAAVSGNAKATAGNLKSICAVNRNAALRYLQVFNLAAGPVNPNVPVFQWPLAPQGSTVPGMLIVGTDFFTDGGMAFATGIAWGISTTNGTYTAATAADHDVSLGYT
jgi:hypothetical protein